MDDTPIQLMYRAPGRDYHQDIVEILDEIMYRLDELTHRIENLEKNHV